LFWLGLRIYGNKGPDINYYIDRYPDEPRKRLNEWQKDCSRTHPTWLDFFLLDARVSYMMNSVFSFKFVNFYYDRDGRLKFVYKFPQKVETKDKIVVSVYDKGSGWSKKSGIDLLEMFKHDLDIIYTYIEILATDMDNDIVAIFYSGGEILLGYFYRGEYHLWKE